jgi:MFS family permease
MAEPNQNAEPARARIVRALGLNRQTGALLAALFLVGLGEELWSPYLPKYLQALGASVFIIGLWSAGKNLLEGFQFWAGGSLAHKLGERGTLALVGLVPIAGYVVFLATDSVAAAIVASFMIGAWESLASPAAFAVVGSSTSLEARTSAFALQAIQKRLPRIVGPLIGGVVLTALGVAAGVKALLAVAVACAVVSVAAQWWLVHERASKETPVTVSKRGVWRAMSPFLKRLWWSDVLVRWCDWMARDFIVLYCMNAIGVTAAFYGGLVALQMTTALITYLPIGAIVRKGHHRPFIGLTFVFFTLVPAVLALAHGPIGLVLAFLVYGLREIGEPARKTIITSGFPETYRARGVGLYWSWRAFAIFPAPVAGAWIWDAFGPRALLWSAFAMGVAGTLLYFGFVYGRRVETDSASD